MSFLQVFENDFKVLLPEIFIMIVLCALLVYGVIYNSIINTTEVPSKLKISSFLMNKEVEIDKPHFNFNKTMSWLIIQTSLIGVLLLINASYNYKVIFNKMLIVDDLSTFVKIIVLLSSSVCLLMSFDYINKEKFNDNGLFEYSILILLAALGMLLLTSSYDFISMYLAIELQSLCLYVLAAYKRDNSLSAEAGLKYFILGALASGIILFGCSMIYGLTGTTNLESLSYLFASKDSISNGVILGLIFVSSGLLFKLGAAPFHMWLPDVYEGSPTPVTAFFAIVPKIATLGLFLRVCYFSFYGLVDYWQEIILICAVLSLVIGAFGALVQTKLKRLLAYSAIGNMGFILIGFATGTPEGIQALLVYMVIYIIMSISLFSVILSLRKKDDNELLVYISDLNGLGKSNPVLAITLAILLFSVAGIPPLAGFCSKLYIFLAAMESSLYLVSIIGVVSSVIATVYYIRLIKIMYFEEVTSVIEFQRIDLVKSIILGVTFLFTILFFAFPTPLLVGAHKIALTLCL